MDNKRLVVIGVVVVVVLSVFLLFQFSGVGQATGKYIGPEQCNTGIDEDGDLKISCADSDCVGSSYCADSGKVYMQIHREPIVGTGDACGWQIGQGSSCTQVCKNDAKFCKPLKSENYGNCIFETKKCGSGGVEGICVAPGKGAGEHYEQFNTMTCNEGDGCVEYGPDGVKCVTKDPDCGSATCGAGDGIAWNCPGNDPDLQIWGDIPQSELLTCNSGDACVDAGWQATARCSTKDVDCGTATCASGDGCVWNCWNKDKKKNIGNNINPEWVPDPKPELYFDEDCDFNVGSSGGENCQAGNGCYSFDKDGKSCIEKYGETDPDCGAGTCEAGDSCVRGCGKLVGKPDTDCGGTSCSAGDGCMYCPDPNDPTKSLDPDCGQATCNAGDGCIADCPDDKYDLDCGIGNVCNGPMAIHKATCDQPGECQCFEKQKDPIDCYCCEQEWSYGGICYYEDGTVPKDVDHYSMGTADIIGSKDELLSKEFLMETCCNQPSKFPNVEVVTWEDYTLGNGYDQLQSVLKDYSTYDGALLIDCKVKEQCKDGIDNDGDGDIDCLDLDCALKDYCAGADLCAFDSDCSGDLVCGLSCEKKVVASGSYEDIAVDDGGNVWVVGDDILFYDGFAWSKKISGVEISDDVIFSSVYIDDNDFWLAGVNTFGDDTGSAFSCDYNDVLPGTCEFKVHKLEYLDGNYPKPFFPKDFVVDGIRVIAVGEKGIITVTNSDMIDFREGSYHAIVDDLDGKYFAVGDRFVSFNVINGRIINFEEQILDYKLFDIFGVDASIAVGEKGKVFLSLYPGSGEFDAPTVKDLYTGWWDKDDHFYVAGQDGVLFKQDLNGVWTKLDSQTTMNIKAGYTTDDGKIILAGDEGIIQLDCQNACVGPQEICNDGIDNDNNNQVDCLDSTCSDFPTCQPDEICENEIDDDKDGKTDCDDSDCLTYCKGLKWATEDDDFDGVLNPFDDCPSSLQGVQVDKDGCSSIVQPEKCIDNDGDGYDTCYLGKGDGKSKDCDDKDDSITACTLGYVCDDSECVSQLCGTDATCQESEYFEGDSLDVTACGVDYNIKVNGITNTCDVDFSWDESGYPVNLPLGSKTLEDVEINVLKIGTGSCQLTTKAIDCEQCVDDTVLIQEINKWLSSKNPNADADLIKSINSWLAGCPT